MTAMVFAPQKLICAPNLNRRPGRICGGVSHDGPYRVLIPRIVLALNRLYRSSDGSIRAPRPLTLLLNRKSPWLRRSPKTVPNGIKSIVATPAAPADRLR